jgi:hypothetical protein
MDTRYEAVAVDFLSAEQADDGTYTYRADEIGQTVRGVSRYDMMELGRRLALPRDTDDWEQAPAAVYSRWAQECSSGEVPE